MPRCKVQDFISLVSDDVKIVIVKLGGEDKVVTLDLSKKIKKSKRIVLYMQEEHYFAVKKVCKETLKEIDFHCKVIREEYESGVKTNNYYKNMDFKVDRVEHKVRNEINEKKVR